MAIKDVVERQKTPIIGKIRLGIKEPGKNFPKRVPFFVLKDAPGVEQVYGPEPTELDVVFLSDDLDSNIPTWYRFYSGGYMDKMTGKFAGGKLQCRGDGETATWFAKMDPVTRIAPTRPCLKEKCPDWNNAKGEKQCRAGMNVLVLLPRVTFDSVYQIDTGSWDSIHNFWNVLAQAQKTTPGGQIRGRPFKIYKTEVEKEYFDAGSSQMKKGKQFIMRMRPNHEFFNLYGEEMRALLQRNCQSIMQLSAPIEEVVNSPLITDDSDEIPALTDQSQHQVDPIQALAEDVDLIEVFNAIAASKGVMGGMAKQKRELNIQKFLHSHPGSSRDVVLAHFRKQIPVTVATAPTQVKPKAAPEPVSAAISEAESNGII